MSKRILVATLAAAVLISLSSFALARAAPTKQRAFTAEQSVTVNAVSPTAAMRNVAPRMAGYDVLCNRSTVDYTSRSSREEGSDQGAPHRRREAGGDGGRGRRAHSRRQPRQPRQMQRRRTPSTPSLSRQTQRWTSRRSSPVTKRRWPCPPTRRKSPQRADPWPIGPATTRRHRPNTPPRNDPSASGARCRSC